MDITFDLEPGLIVGLLVTTVLPLLVGLVTKSNTSSGVKAALLAGLAALTGIGTELLVSIQAGTPYDLGTGLVFAVASFITSVGLHYGLYKPTGTTAAVQEVGVK